MRHAGIMKVSFYLISACSSPIRLYRYLNDFYVRNFGSHLMLHYPIYDGNRVGLKIGQEQLTELCLLDLLPLDGQTILEVGCGNGRQALYIDRAHAAAEIIGLDKNEANIHIAQEFAAPHVTNIRFIRGDAQDMAGIADGSVNVLLSTESAMHYENKNRFLREVRRVLAPGGRFAIYDHLVSAKRQARRAWERALHLHYWSRQDYSAAFLAAGLRVERQLDFTELSVAALQDHRRWILETTLPARAFLQRLQFKAEVTIFVATQLAVLRKHRCHLFVGSR
jgi:ubiquinone/menaquinone biosynthesis C-methylase UbiE